MFCRALRQVTAVRSKPMASSCFANRVKRFTSGVKIGISTDATNFVGTVGAGADFGLTRAIGLRVMAKDYIGRFDTREAIGFDAGNDYTHNWGITVGLKLGF